MTGGWIVGLDIGGTFTDVVMVHPASERLVRYKCLSTPAEPAKGALAGVAGVLETAGIGPEQIDIVLHATTLVSNALIERKGARTALVTTQGFRDILDIAREKKYDIYDLQLEKPAPLTPRHLRFEVQERIAADGSVVTALDPASVSLAAAAIAAAGAEAVAVCLLHSYMNPEHERAVGAQLARELGGVAVTLSCDVLPEIREYERASTSIANAFVQPVVARYLAAFTDGLAAMGIRSGLFIMLSEGGLAAPDLVRRFPVRICESGPAAGAVIAAAIARQRDEKRVLSFDIGGTTAKTALIHDGAPMVATDFEVARMYRFKKGSGLPLKVPVVDLIEIGAGGGSIVRVDALGLLKVGPDSVGADPGPACYGGGGTAATVTDADLVLGYLDPLSFLGGRMTLDHGKARAAIERVAAPLGLDAAAAALGIHAVVNDSMANASRLQAVERGHDPAAYTMVAFGGAGPVHAWGVAQRLGIAQIIVPPTAGLGSALGLLLAPRSFRLSRTYIGRLGSIDWRAVRRLFDDMEREAAQALAAAGAAKGEITLRRTADLRYAGQRKEITVALGDLALDPAGEPALRGVFETDYRQLYHRIHADHPIEMLVWRLEASAPAMTRLPRPAEATDGPRWREPGKHRPMLFQGWTRYGEGGVYRRAELMPGDRLRGPCVVEEDESTSVIGPEGTAEIDRYGNLVIALPGERHA